MSHTHTVHRNEHGEPVLTITVVGAYDVYRFCRGLERLQVEFCATGRRALRQLERRMGRSYFDALAVHLEGSGPYLRRSRADRARAGQL